MFRSDGLTVFLSLIILSAAILTVMVSATYIETLEGRMPIGEFYLLLAFSVLGAMLRRRRRSGDDLRRHRALRPRNLHPHRLRQAPRHLDRRRLKYFLLGIFASAILVYGMAWVYGATGATNLDGIAYALPTTVTGEAFLDARSSWPAPPDRRPRLQDGGGPVPLLDAGRLRGAPTPVTAFMSVVPKAAAFAATVRILVQGLGPLRDDWKHLIAILAC